MLQSNTSRPVVMIVLVFQISLKIGFRLGRVSLQPSVCPFQLRIDGNVIIFIVISDCWLSSHTIEVAVCLRICVNGVSF